MQTQHHQADQNFVAALICAQSRIEKSRLTRPLASQNQLIVWTPDT